MLENWERAAAGWGRQADRVRQTGMPVSAWLIDQARLQAGQRVLELAAGPGDTGFLAAELVSPGGVVVCSDASEAMLDLARERAREMGVGGVEFRRLELEWIDLPTASVDAILCRWGLMLCLDPAAALSECRRVLRPGGRLAVAVWDAADANPAMALPGRALAGLGLGGAPPSDGPGPFALAGPGVLRELLDDAGFLEVVVEPVGIERRFASIRDWIGETLDLSMMFAGAWRELDGAQRRRLTLELEALAGDFLAPDGSLRIPGRSLGAAADA
jgi:SAM-dependent methyltransferase